MHHVPLHVGQSVRARATPDLTRTYHIPSHATARASAPVGPRDFTWARGRQLRIHLKGKLPTWQLWTCCSSTQKVQVQVCSSGLPHLYALKTLYWNLFQRVCCQGRQVLPHFHQQCSCSAVHSPSLSATAAFSNWCFRLFYSPHLSHVRQSLLPPHRNGPGAPARADGSARDRPSTAAQHRCFTLKVGQELPHRASWGKKQDFRSSRCRSVHRLHTCSAATGNTAEKLDCKERFCIVLKPS